MAASYGRIAKGLHWLMALMIIGLLAVGLYMTGMENSSDKFRLYGLHKATGIMVLVLVCFRLFWRFVHTPPPLPPHMKWVERMAAHSSHAVLYIIMFVLPLSGWAMSSAAGFPVSVYGFFTLPNLIAPNKELVDLLKEVHELIAYGLIGLIGLHMSAALFHHFYHKDDVLTRMVPFRK